MTSNSRPSTELGSPINPAISDPDWQRFAKSRSLQERCHWVIPGGSHTYAKGDDQYPAIAPAYLVRGEGCRVWDVDGNEFVEYGMGLRAVTIGHAYRPIIDAAYKQMLLGINFTRPGIIELEAAEKILSMVPGEMVKFAKNGSDVTTAAVKLARAATGRDKVAVCAEHPFFSIDDWFIGTTNMNAGIPNVVSDLTLHFHFNDIDSLKRLFAEHPGQIACVMLEAETATPPQPGFLHSVQQICRDNGALFVLDEMITGFRWHVGGAQKVYDLSPDLATFGKATANGFSVSALVGRREIMELGGLTTGKERVFLLSTTHGAEHHSLAACIATIDLYQHEDVVGFLHRQGDRLRDGITRVAGELGVSEHFQVLGRSCNLVFATRDQQKNPSQPFRTLFLQEMIRRGFLTPSLVVSYSHTDDVIERTITAVGESLEIYAKSLAQGVDKYLVGRPVKPVFRKYN